MTWEDIIAKKTKRGIRGPFDRRGRSSLYFLINEYDQDELLEIFLKILYRMTDGKAMKYYEDAQANLHEMKEDGTEDKYLKGMDEREYILRYTLLQASRDGEEWATAGASRITLSKMISKIFGEKDFKI
jgi:hypothetical protein|tara:strand:+ start:461 stop:847 length:387 start_codon:yes stop_codon:yes gene_type:complete